MTKRKQILEILKIIKHPPRKIFGAGSKLDEDIIINKLKEILNDDKITDY